MRNEHELRAENELLKQSVAGIVEKVRQLREAIDTELVCCGIGTLDSMESPKHAIAAIGKWHYDLGASGVCEHSSLMAEREQQQEEQSDG